MAFTSFTLRNTVSDNGSSLRRTNVTQDGTTPNGSGKLVFDSGLRADGYFLPVPESFLESSFEANVYKRTEIELSYQFGFSLVASPGASPEPVEVLIRASSYGEPVTAGDGDFVTNISPTSTVNASGYIDRNTTYIKEGSWVYYAMFVRYQDSNGDGFYERVATLSIQIPRDFNSTKDLWDRIPLHYKGLDEEYALKTDDYAYTNGPLYRYIELFGWELDKIRTTIYDTMRINDPDVVHSSAIDSLANQSGVEFQKDALGTAKLRAILNNIGYLRRTKGTVNSVEAYISALSGCGISTISNFDENNWASTDALGSSGEVKGIAYGDNRWVAVGKAGKTSTSTNGTTWSTPTTVGNTRDLNSVAYGNGLWIAVGRSASNAFCIYKSTDGATWTGVFNGPSTGTYIFNDVTYANGVWVAVGLISAAGGVLLCTSSDGNTWTVKSTGVTGGYELNEVAYGNNKWIATSTSQQFVVSTDNGSTWSAVAQTPLIGPANSIYYSNNIWITSVSNYIFRSLDNGATWTVANTVPPVNTFVSFSKISDTWLAVDIDGYVYASEDTNDWYLFYASAEALNDIAVGGNRIVLARLTSVLTNTLLVEFNVHPMRANLVTDPFFNQASTGPAVSDTGITQRKWASYTTGSRSHGWGVYALFSADPATDMVVSTSEDKLTVTLPPLSGTVSVLIYSRGFFSYNNNLTYYFSANASHDYKPRFLNAEHIIGFEALSPPPSISYFDDWNNAVTTFPVFKDFLTNDTRKIVASIPNATSVSPTPVVPTFKFDITLSSSETTVLTFEKPMVEYRNSSGAFFSGNEPLGGFIQDPTGSMGAGSYDYHWGVNAGSAQHTDFSYYTLDFHRVKSVVDNVIENYIVPVNIVKNTDYVINWDVLE